MQGRDSRMEKELPDKQASRLFRSARALPFSIMNVCSSAALEQPRPERALRFQLQLPDPRAGPALPISQGFRSRSIVGIGLSGPNRVNSAAA